MKQKEEMHRSTTNKSNGAIPLRRDKQEARERGEQEMSLEVVVV